MTWGKLLTASGLFSIVWGAGMYIQQNVVKTQIATLKIELFDKIEDEVAKNENVWTVEEVADLIRQDQQKDNEDLKSLIKESNKKSTDDFKKYMQKERMKYDTIYFEDANGNKALLIGKMIKGNFYHVEKIDVDKFPFE